MWYKIKKNPKRIFKMPDLLAQVKETNTIQIHNSFMNIFQDFSTWISAEKTKPSLTLHCFKIGRFFSRVCTLSVHLAQTTERDTHTLLVWCASTNKSP